ncbi:hypothetical protein IQ260_05310 [Leptolyngbya cf. ectocarpi LEGE 11479]|uniref:Uncharacterized protein n=1 Tax=Leptolyngbya cf. ectocarpi LEGE 11479 TaxID=1828722 RepID=A0A928X1G1_LEPEC|nr:hypothetical protein [Leptolyngbya ectocarpi]MBE9066066.1 hypothetical protein [Leptolyngbya cf. ectocarpi LEGE 11479]
MTITIPKGAPFGQSPNAPRPKREQPGTEYGASETYSRNILGPVEFEMCELHVVASVADPALPEQVAPANKAQIVEKDEYFKLRVKVVFNHTPLTKLLLCLGIDVKINFCIEGCGGKATEVDVSTKIKTEKDKYQYDIEWAGTPNGAGMTPGFYVVAAVANIEMSEHPCAPCLLGAGYVAGVLMQVYDA